jgi:hypothetical protein
VGACVKVLVVPFGEQSRSWYVYVAYSFIYTVAIHLAHGINLAKPLPKVFLPFDHEL